MSLRAPITKALTCRNCQQWLLRSFITGVSGLNPIQSPPISQQQRRTFTRTRKRHDTAYDRVYGEYNALQEIHEIDEANDSEPPQPPAQGTPPTATLQEAEAEPPAQNEPLPWYLQPQPPIQQPTDSPFSSRQHLPSLPSHPPPLLQPILNHVSLELGIDDLTLLDLRSLDPPPALGANLLMIIGTARSEKHLHVSADRLCRWLRTEHKMRPYADGLLGRNELKLKLRRKAKRTRLLSAVGAKETGEGDVEEGIRTGWVCVNVGRVGGGELLEVKEREDTREGFVGFGKASGGSSVVVQMMTEEKRGEVDLERLWMDMLNRDKKAKGKIEEGAGDSGEATEATEDANSRLEAEASGAITQTQQQQPSPSPSSYFPLGSVSNQNAGQQLRTYQTSARQNMATAIASRSPTDLDMTPNSPHQTLTADPSTTKLLQLLSDLKTAPRSRAFDMLGPDLLPAVQRFSLTDARPEPTPGTGAIPFLHTFYTAMPAFPQPQHWHMHLELLAHARSLGHTDAHAPLFAAQVSHMLIAGLVPEERTFVLVLRALLSPLGTKVERYDGGKGVWPSWSKMVYFFDVMEVMEGCGYDAVSSEILALLYRNCVGLPPSPSPGGRGLGLDTLVDGLAAARLRRQVRSGDVTAFWRTWRSYPQRFLPRTAAMYRVFFQSIAEGKLGTVRDTREILATALAEMEREEPAVGLEADKELAGSVVDAIQSVDPGARDGSEVARAWKVWYERAQRVVGDA